MGMYEESIHAVLCIHIHLTHRHVFTRHAVTHTHTGNPLDDAKLLFNTVASIVRANALRSQDSKSFDVSFGSKATEEFQSRVGASA